MAEGAECGACVRVVRGLLAAALLLTSAAIAQPPPPPPPPSAALDRLVEGHNLGWLFVEYRRHLNARIRRQMDQQGSAMLVAASGPRPESRSAIMPRARSVAFTARGFGGGEYVRASAVEYCPSNFQVVACTWIYAQVTRRANALIEADFQSEAAALALHAAGVTAPASGEPYPERIVDVIGGSSERIAAAFSSHRLTSADCPALLQFPAVLQRLPEVVRRRIAVSPTEPIDLGFSHAPTLELQFIGGDMSVAAYSGVGQPEIVGNAWDIVQNASRECGLPEWPSPY